LSDYEDDLSDYSTRPELSQFDSQRPPKPAAQPEAAAQLPPLFRPEPTPTVSSTGEDSQEDEDENLLLPEVTQTDQPDLFSFPQNLDGFADTFLKFSPERPESIGKKSHLVTLVFK
jgi:hypothetical protein